MLLLAPGVVSTSLGADKGAPAWGHISRARLISPGRLQFGFWDENKTFLSTFARLK